MLFRSPSRLTTEEQKLALLETAGVQLVLVVPFTLDFSQWAPRMFVEELVHRRIGAQAVCIGANFRFGHGQAGDARFLAALGKEFGFEVYVVEPVVVRGEVASSSFVRALVREGDVRSAARLLGRLFSLTGQVRTGEGRGRQLGFPTLNFSPEQECLPANGVYITETRLAARTYPSVTNVGVRPTFDGSVLVVESHLLGFSGTIEATRLEVQFHERLREERKFPSLRALQAQIAQDVERARQFFAQKQKCDAQLAKKGPAG